MNLDENLIRRIKSNLSIKSTAELRAVLRSQDRETWSGEALVAARELLMARGDQDVPKVVEDLKAEGRSFHGLTFIAAALLLIPISAAIGAFIGYLLGTLAMGAGMPSGGNSSFITGGFAIYYGTGFGLVIGGGVGVVLSLISSFRSRGEGAGTKK